MSFDVSALSNYTIQNEKLLVTKSLFDAKTQKLIQGEGNVMATVKSSETINVLTTDAIFQTGGTCGFNSSGSTAFTQRTVTVGKIKVHESLCPKTLESKYTQLALAAGSIPEAIPFEKQYTDLKSGTIAEQFETALWLGDTGSSDVNLNKFDGLVKLILNSGASINGNTTGITTSTGITATNALTIVKNIKNAIPARVKGKKDVRIFCGWDVFDVLVDAYVNANLFNWGASQLSYENGEFVIPGTAYKVTAIHGLDGSNKLYAMRTSNMYLGCDILGEEDKWEIFYAKEAMEVRFVMEAKLGVNIAFPAEVVSFILV
ncbi:hypothetical protein UFOVP208_41 [uncultured Caudovirales phage]|uniref:Phage major capsid protein n=1 Tax=uncultured Caudovirales phage TaxID=2100421 RepID=A0A6J7WJ47_9CAUD|nr:hypothetical protein UFOVP208_41 [uncultured Caudovirales phage]